MDLQLTCSQSAVALSDLPRILEERIIGQRFAIARISRAVQAAELGLNNTGARPKGSFLLLGPTGVGKTESAKCFTEAIFGSPETLEMIFMNEYSSDQRLSEFFGRVEMAIRRHPKGTTLLFDEIEKGHPRTIDVLLSLLEEGVLTTPSDERIRVRQFYVVLTSNLGSGDLAKMENAPYATMERVALDIAQKLILYKLIRQKLEVLSIFFGRAFEIDRGPVTAFLLRVGYSRAFGARMLRQEVDRQFNSASLPWALTRKVPERGLFRYDPAGGCLALE